MLKRIICIILNLCILFGAFNLFTAEASAEDATLVSIQRYLHVYQSSTTNSTPSSVDFDSSYDISSYANYGSNSYTSAENKNCKVISHRFIFNVKMPPYTQCTVYPTVEGSMQKVQSSSGTNRAWCGIGENRSSFLVPSSASTSTPSYYNIGYATTQKQGVLSVKNDSSYYFTLTNNTAGTVTKGYHIFVVFGARNATQYKFSIKTYSVNASVNKIVTTQLHRSNHNVSLDCEGVGSDNIWVSNDGDKEYCYISRDTSTNYYDGIFTPFVNNKKNVCLNGHSYTFSNSNNATWPRGRTITIPEGNTLNICDCMNTGSIQSAVIVNNGTLNIYGGTINTDWYKAVENYGELNIYGGAIQSSGNVTVVDTENGQKVTTAPSRAVENYGVMNVYGGKISGLDTGIYNQGTLNISGKPVINGGTTDIYLCKDKIINIGEEGFESDSPVVVDVESEPMLGRGLDITNQNETDYLSVFKNNNSEYNMLNNNGVIQLVINDALPAVSHASFVAESNEGENAEPFAKSHMASGDEIIEQDNTGGINGSTVATVFESTVTGEEEPQYLAWFVSIPTENTYIKSTDGTSGYDNIVLGDTPVVTDSDNVTQGKGSIYSAEGSDEGFNLRYKYTVDSPQTNADNQYVFSLIIDNIYSPYANAQLKVCTAEEYNALTQYEDITNK
ncbi:MAG: hypothetical protein Q4D26_04750 [Clostridia bacterium]|nr:hypothetical protein [Clostridia bacterium]